MAHFLIIGANGRIWIAAVRRALGAGLNVRAMACKADRIKMSHPLLMCQNSNVPDPQATCDTLAGVDAVVHVINVAPSLRRMTRPNDVVWEKTAVLVAEMPHARVRRIVTVTGFGANDSRPALSFAKRIPHRSSVGMAKVEKDRQELISSNRYPD